MADVQTDLTAIRDELLRRYFENFTSLESTDLGLAIKRLLSSLPVPDTEALRKLIAKWRAEKQQIDSFHATMGTGYGACADELSALLSRSAQEPPTMKRETGTPRRNSKT